MIIKDLFKKDITRPIQGVVTIGNEDEEQKWQELEEYVCTDEITKSFRTFFADIVSPSIIRPKRSAYGSPVSLDPVNHISEDPWLYSRK